MKDIRHDENENPVMSHDYTLITNLLQTVSMPVLEDWVDFFDRPPKTIICFFGGNRDSETLLRSFCEDRGIALIVTPEDLTEDIRKHDLPILRWQFAHAPDPYCVRISLDTLPYRDGHDGWFDACIDTMKADDLLFVTGSTRNYRSDQSHPTAGYFRTQRVSFNFFLTRPQVWLSLEKENSHLEEVYGRYHSEGFLEQYCREQGKYGLRLENTPDFRIFHVQAWDERMMKVREAFHAGRGIGPFLKGWEEDQRHPWTMWYMYPKPSLLKRIRIELGRIRREMFAS